MLADPVPARFCRLITLTIGRFIDHASVTDPARNPAVIATRSVPNTPPELRQRKLLSDCQPLDSQAVNPTRDAPV
jgi:hypothetical protein